MMRISTIFLCLLLFLETKQDESIREIVSEVLEKINERDDFVKVLNLTARTLEGWFTPGRNSTKVEFNTLTGSGRIIKSNLILDGYPRSEFGEKLFEETGLLRNQVAFFHEVMPELENLHIEINDQSERSWVGSFGIKNKIIILEDVMADKNYTRPDKNKGLDMKQSEMAIRTLAKYHAMTAVLVERNRIYLNHFNKSVFERNQNKIKNYYQLFFNYLADAIESKWEPEWNETAQLIRAKSVNVTNEMLGIYKRNDSSFNVLNNGGYTITNFLFVYGISDVFVSNDPIAMKVENSLNAFYNSPAFDLQMFINTSPNIETMMTKKDELVQVYYDSLSTYLEKFNYKGRKPTFEEIKSEIKRTDYLGLIYAANGLCYTFLDPNEIVDLVNVVQKSWENNEVVIEQKCLFGKQYVQYMKMILNKYFNNKI